MLISPIAGAVADRFGKRRIMMITQSGTALVFAALTALVATGAVQLWHVYLSATIAGVLWRFRRPGPAGVRLRGGARSSARQRGGG